MYLQTQVITHLNQISEGIGNLMRAVVQLSLMRVEMEKMDQNMDQLGKLEVIHSLKLALNCNTNHSTPETSQIW